MNGMVRFAPLPCKGLGDSVLTQYSVLGDWNGTHEPEQRVHVNRFKKIRALSGTVAQPDAEDEHTSNFDDGTKF